METLWKSAIENKVLYVNVFNMEKIEKIISVSDPVNEKRIRIQAVKKADPDPGSGSGSQIPDPAVLQLSFFPTFFYIIMKYISVQFIIFLRWEEIKMLQNCNFLSFLRRKTIKSK